MNEEFYTALKTGNLTVLKKMLAENPSIKKQKTLVNATALHVAAAHGRTNVIMSLFIT